MDGDREPGRDARFSGRIPDLYQGLLVPMIFEEPARSVAQVVASLGPRRILETACGTGALTRELVRACPDAEITATDLNQPMLDAAAALSPDDRVTWRQADALDLPFEDGGFDVVACQFGAMFLPDRVRGFREAARVLAPGGTFVLTTWDRLESSEVPWVVQSALLLAEPDEPLTFMERVPHGYFDPERIGSDLDEAGMPGAAVRVVNGTSHTTATDAARAFCLGTPLRNAIEEHPSLDLERATVIAEDALVRHFGAGPIAAPIRWLEVTARPA